jgi:hypothetical protein
MAVAHWWPQGRFNRPVGLVDPLWPQWQCAFVWWLSSGPSSRFQVSIGFGGGLDTFVGHRIHVIHACQLLIRWASLPWIGDISDSWCLAWQPLIGWNDGVEGWGVLLFYFLCFLPAFKYTLPLVEFVSISPYSTMVVYFSCKNAGVDGHKYGA